VVGLVRVPVKDGAAVTPSLSACYNVSVLGVLLPGAMLKEPQFC